MNLELLHTKEFVACWF